jgi:radical SAM protein with 4Fe4S-binding SPASM domain
MRRLVEDGKLSEEVLDQGELYRYLKEKLDSLLENGPTPSSKVVSTYKPKDKKIFGKGIFISNNGTVMPSSFLPIGLGNVRNDSLAGIYAGAEVLKEMHDSTKLKGRCGICEFNDICRGSRSRAYATTGDYLAEDPCCAYQPGTVGKIANSEAILEELKVTNFSRRVS